MVLLSCMAQTTPNQTTELETLLARAAELAAKAEIDSAEFMSAAWNAILDAHPGMREALADKELRTQLKKLRKQGLIPLA